MNAFGEDTVPPFRTKLENDIPRSYVLKKYADKIRDLNDANTSTFKGNKDALAEVLKECARQNLWELCYFLKTATSYRISKRYFNNISATALQHGCYAFYYAFCSLAISSFLYPFPEVAKIDSAQKEYLEHETTKHYEEDIDSRGWKLNDFFGM